VQLRQLPGDNKCGAFTDVGDMAILVYNHEVEPAGLGAGVRSQESVA
jgi:hypothetical protein